MVCMCGAEAYVSGFDLVEQMRGECGQETTEIDVVNANAAIIAIFTKLITVSLELRNVVAFSSASQACGSM